MIVGPRTIAGLVMAMICGSSAMAWPALFMRRGCRAKRRMEMPGEYDSNIAVLPCNNAMNPVPVRRVNAVVVEQQRSSNDDIGASRRVENRRDSSNQLKIQQRQTVIEQRKSSCPLSRQQVRPVLNRPCDVPEAGSCSAPKPPVVVETEQKISCHRKPRCQRLPDLPKPQNRLQELYLEAEAIGGMITDIQSRRPEGSPIDPQIETLCTALKQLNDEAKSLNSEASPIEHRLCNELPQKDNDSQGATPVTALAQSMEQVRQRCRQMKKDSAGTCVIDRTGEEDESRASERRSSKASDDDSRADRRQSRRQDRRQDRVEDGNAKIVARKRVQVEASSNPIQRDNAVQAVAQEERRTVAGAVLDNGNSNGVAILRRNRVDLDDGKDAATSAIRRTEREVMRSNSDNVVEEKVRTFKEQAPALAGTVRTEQRLETVPSMEDLEKQGADIPRISYKKEQIEIIMDRLTERQSRLRIRLTNEHMPSQLRRKLTRRLLYATQLLKYYRLTLRSKHLNKFERELRSLRQKEMDLQHFIDSDAPTVTMKRMARKQLCQLQHRIKPVAYRAILERQKSELECALLNPDMTVTMKMALSSHLRSVRKHICILIKQADRSPLDCVRERLAKRMVHLKRMLQSPVLSPNMRKSMGRKYKCMQKQLRCLNVRIRLYKLYNQILRSLEQSTSDPNVRDGLMLKLKQVRKQIRRFNGADIACKMVQFERRLLRQKNELKRMLLNTEMSSCVRRAFLMELRHTCLQLRLLNTIRLLRTQMATVRQMLGTHDNSPNVSCTLARQLKMLDKRYNTTLRYLYRTIKHKRKICCCGKQFRRVCQMVPDANGQMVRQCHTVLRSKNDLLREQQQQQQLLASSTNVPHLIAPVGTHAVSESPIASAQQSQLTPMMASPGAAAMPLRSSNLG